MEQYEHKAKMIAPQQPFKLNSTSGGVFTTDYQVYNLDDIPPKERVYILPPSSAYQLTFPLNSETNDSWLNSCTTIHP